jgi:cell wall integrity and stress response component
MILTCEDVCGNETVGLFSYVQIGQGSGTQTATNPLSTSSRDVNLPPTLSEASTATITVSHGTTLVVTSFLSNTPATTISSAGSGMLTAISSTTPNQTDGSHQSATAANQPSFWNSTGKVAGIFVAVGVVVAILAMVPVWLFRRRRARQDEEKPVENFRPLSSQEPGEHSFSRSTSLLQLLTGRDHDDRQDKRACPSPTTGQKRMSGGPQELVVPVVDQRLDPQSMMIRFDDGDSQTSFRDEDDYSRRVWRVTNASDSDSLESSE